jgi:hypothetical protein
MKHTWNYDADDFDDRLEEIPRPRSAFDDICTAVLVLSAIYFGGHLIAWWLR